VCLCIGAGNLSCSKYFSYYWYLIALNFAVIMGSLMSLAAGFFHHSRVAWTAFYAIVSYFSYQVYELAAELMRSACRNSALAVHWVLKAPGV
jgi:xanthine/uracil permease